MVQCALIGGQYSVWSHLRQVHVGMPVAVTEASLMAD